MTSQPEKRYMNDQSIWRKKRCKGGTYTENLTITIHHVTLIYNTFSHFVTSFVKKKKETEIWLWRILQISMNLCNKKVLLKKAIAKKYQWNHVSSRALACIVSRRSQFFNTTETNGVKFFCQLGKDESTRGSNFGCQKQVSSLIHQKNTSTLICFVLCKSVFI